METLANLANGHFSPRALRVYLATLSGAFLGLIFLCWRQFPEENAFSILTHTFSYLGSFNEDRNPEGWPLFCIAVTGWGLASVPLVRYTVRRLAPTAVLALECRVGLHGGEHGGERSRGVAAGADGPGRGWGRRPGLAAPPPRADSTSDHVARPLAPMLTSAESDAAL